MGKRDMKKALGASLKAEEKAVQERFTKAENVLSRTSPTSSESNVHPKSDGKVIRDSFTIPDTEYAVISLIKKRCMKAGVSANKSEILRAGLAALKVMPDKELAEIFESLNRVKTGRPPTKQ